MPPQFKQILKITCLTQILFFASVSNIAFANPTDGIVSAGNASIISSGNILTVDQSSQKAVIDWRGFDIDTNETTQFQQPSSSSITLNRVKSGGASQINGNLIANGNIFIINPNGVIFGEGSKVDVNGLIASTADLDNDSFMDSAGAINLNKPGNNENAKIINQGQITAKDAGLVGLVAPQVENSGIINAKLGHVQLASGDTATADFYGDGLLEVALSDKVKTQLVSNSGSIHADGGIIALTAASGRNVVDSLVENKGSISAQTVSTKNGVITLSNLSNSGKVVNRGTINAKGTAANTKGGKIKLLGDNITVASGSEINASGKSGGGTILIGGDIHGSGTDKTAKTTIVEKDAFLKADAESIGDGGKIIVWADDTAVFAGDISAKGGELGGHGGFAETSGKNFLTVSGNVDLTAPTEDELNGGRVGTWLLDPTNITIYNRSQGADNTNTFTTAYLESQSTSANINLLADNSITLDLTGDALTVANNRNFSLTATSGQITSASNGTITTSGTGTIDLTAGTDILFANDLDLNTGSGAVTLRANGNINYSGSGDITTAGGNIILNSDRDGNSSGAIRLDAGTVLTSNGGNITLGGGTNPATTAAFGNGSSTYLSGILLYGATLNAKGTSSGGNIILRGQGSTAGAGAHGILLDNTGTVVETNYSGAINLTGVGGNAPSTATNIGIFFRSNGRVTSTDGDITINGTGGNGNTDNDGIVFSTSGLNKIESIGNGNVTLTGIGVGASGGSANHGIIFNTPSGGVFTKNGMATINAAAGSGSGSYGINFSNNQSIVGGANATNRVSLITDTITGYMQNLQTTGDVVIRPYTANTSVGIGSGTLNLSSSFFNNINYGGTLWLGGYGLTGLESGYWNSSGNFTFNANQSFSKNVNILSGGHIVSSAAYTLTLTGAANAVLYSIGDLYFTYDFDITATGTGSVTARANGDIVYSGSGDITTAGGNIILNADRDGNGRGTIYLGTGTNVASNNGNITLGGGTNPDTTPAYGYASYNNGILLLSSTINSGTGSIKINGTGYALGSATAHSGAIGLKMDGSSITATGSGNIDIVANGGGSTGTGYGLDIVNTSSINAQNGDINITAVGGTGNGGDNPGILFSGGGTNTVNSTGTGAINITGTGGGISGSSFNYGILFNSANGGVLSKDGTVTITGKGGYGGTAAGSFGFAGGTAAKLGGSAATNKITIISDTAITNAFATVNTTGNVTVKPYLDTTTISVASSGGMSLSSSFLNSITAGSITIGSSSHNGAINAYAYSWLAPVTMLSNNASISILGTQTMGARSFAAQTYGTGDIIWNGGSITTSATGTAVSLNSNASISASNTNSISSSAGTVSASSVGNMNLVPITATGVTATASGSGSSITTGNIAVGSGGNISLTADDLIIGGALSGTGTATLQPYATGRTVCVNYSAGSCASNNFGISTSEISNLTEGWGGINLGRTDGSTRMYLGASSWSDPINFRNYAPMQISGNITGTDDASLTFTNNLSSYAELFGNLVTNGRAVTFNQTVVGYGGSINTYGGNLSIGALSLSENTSFNTANGTISFTGGAQNQGSNNTVGKTLTLNAGTNNITIGGTVNGSYNVSVTAGSMIFNNSWGNTTPLGSISLISTNSLSLPSITSSSIFAQTTGATSDITLASGKVLTASGSGNALTLVSGRDFINNAGSGALALTGSGRWLIYSANPTNTIGEENLSQAFNRYSCSYNSNGTCAANATLGTTIAIPVSGNGLIYSYTPTITATPNAISNIVYGDAIPDLNGYAYTLSGYRSGEGTDAVTGSLNGSTTYTTSSDIGTYNINHVSGTLSSALGYAISYANKSNAFTVAAKNITASLIGTVSKIYDGLSGAILNSANYSLTGLINGDSITVSNTSGTYDNKNVGSSKSVTVTGLTLVGTKTNNYTLTNPSTISGNIGEVTKRDITITANNQNITYGDGNNFNGYTVGAGLQNGEMVTGVNLATNATSSSSGNWNYNSTPWVITASNATGSNGFNSGNYNITYTDGSLTIAQKALSITATGIDKTYDGLFTGNVNLSDNRIANDVFTKSYSTALYNDKNAGTNKTLNVNGLNISGTDSGNYTYNTTASTTANISKKALTITANNQNITYGDGNNFNGYTVGAGLQNGEMVTGVNLATNATSSSSSNWNYNATPWVITASNATGSNGFNSGNYNITYTDGSLTIAQKALSITATGIDKTYDGTATASINLSDNRIANDVFNISYNASYADKNVGNNKTLNVNGLNISGTDSGNYTYNTTASTTANIGKKALTITANNQNITYGDGNNFNGYTVGAGLQNGEMVTGVNLATNATSSSSSNWNYNATPWVITASNATGSNGFNSGNYNITYTDGSLTIAQKALSITATGIDKTYDGTATASINLSDNRIANDVFNISYNASYADKNVGNNKLVTVNNIAISGANAGNYSLSNTSATSNANITPKTLVITANNEKRLYLNDNPEFSVNYYGLVSGDTLSDISNLLISSTATIASLPGIYSIIPGGATSPNYNISFINGQLTIFPKDTIPNTVTGVSQKPLIATVSPLEILFSDTFKKLNDPDVEEYSKVESDNSVSMCNKDSSGEVCGAY